MGFTLPGTLLPCGDSHTCTHGGMGAIAFGIGASEVAHVLATQAIVQRKPQTLRATVEGELPKGGQPKVCPLDSSEAEDDEASGDVVLAEST